MVGYGSQIMRVVYKIRRLSQPARRRAWKAIYRARYGWPAPPHPRPRDEQPWLPVVQALLARWERYHAATVDLTISEHDDMFENGNLRPYLSAGTSALEIISEAMLLARKTHFGNLLDMPCGYGRVTRHLVKFFPDSAIFVSEVDKAKQRFCASKFAAEQIDLPADFSGEPVRHFDLIFVGSLLTHLNENLSNDMLHYLVRALSEGGLLVFTTCGRHGTVVSAGQGYVEPNALHRFARKGFVYEGAPTYGSSRMAPSWVLRTLESMPDARVLGHKEQGWGTLQDVFVIEKDTGWTWPRPLKPRWPWVA